MNDTAQSKTPWHLWVVGIITLFWNSIGIFSYVSTQTGNLESLGMTPEQIAYFDSVPPWADAFWALGVWGAFLGSILLLFRSRWAVTSISISIIGLIGSTIFQRFITDIPEELDSIGLSALIWVTTLFMLGYSMRMRRQGILR